MESMSERLRRLRKEHGYTLEEVGKYLGIQRAGVAKYEHGATENIKRKNIIKLCRLYHVSPTYLLALEDLDIESEPEMPIVPKKLENTTVAALQEISGNSRRIAERLDKIIELLEEKEG